VKRKRSGLTVIEILVVVGIIALLVGMLIPAVSTVRRMAKEVKQKAQFTAIDLALAAFKDDYGDYPPSDHFSWLADIQQYEDSSGAQKLAEALLGWDLLGFHPDSGFRADGMNRWPYEAADGTRHAPGAYFLYNRADIPGVPINPDIEKRKGRYVELDTANALRLGMLFDVGTFGLADRFVLCDVFGKGREVVLQGPIRATRVKAGHPILYYRANASQKESQFVYDHFDNDTLIQAKEQADKARRGQRAVPWNPLAGQADAFHRHIADPRASTVDFYVPYKPDSYILISAGSDGLYGTDDDITNFGR
jgi:type II secretory pathway pseudopilin PulG